MNITIQSPRSVIIPSPKWSFLGISSQVWSLSNVRYSGLMPYFTINTIRTLKGRYLNLILRVQQRAWHTVLDKDLRD